MAGLMIMSACRSSRSPELLYEHNSYSSSPYVPEETLLFHLFAFFCFCTVLYSFVLTANLQLDEQEMFRKQMKNYVKEKKQYDLKFLRSRYANGIPKYQFNNYPPLLPYRTFENFDRIFYYLYKCFLVVLMSILSYEMANSILD
jgi:hypothetical protein